MGHFGEVAVQKRGEFCHRKLCTFLFCHRKLPLWLAVQLLLHSSLPQCAAGGGAGVQLLYEPCSKGPCSLQCPTPSDGFTWFDVVEDVPSEKGCKPQRSATRSLQGGGPTHPDTRGLKINSNQTSGVLDGKHTEICDRGEYTIGMGSRMSPNRPPDAS